MGEPGTVTTFQESSVACWLEILLKLAQSNQIRFAKAPLTMRRDLKPAPAGSAIRRHAHIAHYRPELALQKIRKRSGREGIEHG